MRTEAQGRTSVRTAKTGAVGSVSSATELSLSQLEELLAQKQLEHEKSELAEAKAKSTNSTVTASEEQAGSGVRIGDWRPSNHCNGGYGSPVQRSLPLNPS